MTGASPFATMEKANPEWRKGLAGRFFEIDSAVQEMRERAAHEEQQTGRSVSPRKHAKAMDADRVAQGEQKKSGKGKPTPVASYVKNTIGPLRAERNRKQKGEPQNVVCNGVS